MSVAVDDIALDAVPTVARPYRLQYEEAQSSWVLLYPEGMVKLNGPAGEILSRCDGARDVAAVVAELERAFDRTGPGQGLDADVRGFLAVALERGWVRLAPSPE